MPPRTLQSTADYSRKTPRHSRRSSEYPPDPRADPAACLFRLERCDVARQRPMSSSGREETMVNGDRLVLVTGATGRQGGAAIRHMSSKGWRLRALTRDPNSHAARELARRGVEVLRGDL